LEEGGLGEGVGDAGGEVEVRIVDDDTETPLPDTSITDDVLAVVVGVASRLNNVRLASVRQIYFEYVASPSVK
jgi:hypothetical protein